MDKSYTLEFLKVTEAAAIASARWIGKGDEKSADHAAVEAMRHSFDGISFDGTIVIGEGERDNAPMLYIGESVGTGLGERLHIACDPLEGTTLTALGKSGALSVIAIADENCLLKAPDCYMQKIAVGPAAKGAIDLTRSISWNLHSVCKSLNKHISELSVVVLNRTRHETLIETIRAEGARVVLIEDGDVAAAMSCCSSNSGIDILMGTGGAPEGVLAAAALQCLGGDFLGRLILRPEDITRAHQMGVSDPSKIYTINELSSGPVIFAATGVTDGSLLAGVSFTDNEVKTQSIIMRSDTKTIRHIEGIHNLRV